MPLSSFISDRVLQPLSRRRAQRLLTEGIEQISQGAPEAAITALVDAHTKDPNNAAILTNLGAAYALSQRLEDAAGAFANALDVEATHWPALINIAETLIQLAQPTAALPRFADAEQVSPLPDEARMAHAKVLIAARDFHAAYAGLRRPPPTLRHSYEYWLLYGIACQFVGFTVQAEAAFRHARRLDANALGATTRHGRLIGDIGHDGSARSALARAKVEHGGVEATISFVRTLARPSQRTSAIKLYRDVLEREPGNTEAMTNLGNLLKLEGEFDSAERLYRQVLGVNPQNAAIHKNLGDLLARSLRVEEGISHLRTATEQDPRNPYLLSDLIFAEQYAPTPPDSGNPSSVATWREMFGKRRMPDPRVKGTAPRGRLRVGLLSGNFRRHPVGFLALPILEALDQTKISILTYANQTVSDEVTARFRTLSDHWKTVAHLNDQTLLDMIRDDRLDVLLEMSGHAVGHRLPVLAERAAPVQIKWVGGQYATMGVEAIDYFLSDPVETPPECEHLYSETVLKLPVTYAGYKAPSYAPGVSALPALSNGWVTFGSLNKINKINDLTIELWATCLNAVPDSRLLLTADGFGDASTIARCQKKFAASGIAPSRLDLRATAPHEDALATYNEIDIALDPHPYSGCLTTCEALWMGVPVLTWPGKTFAGRHSASFLTTVGLRDWIADGPEDYVRVLTDKCSDLSALNDLRLGLRDRVAASPLCDFKQIAADLERCLLGVAAQARG